MTHPVDLRPASTAQPTRDTHNRVEPRTTLHLAVITALAALALLLAFGTGC